MPGPATRFALAVGVLIGGTRLLAADPPPSEELPAPRAIPAVPSYPAPRFVVPAPYGPYPAYQRQNRWDVWQNYEVARDGTFRPLVVYSPYGPYYRFDGRPYPYAPTHQLEFIPSVSGTPYRSRAPEWHVEAAPPVAWRTFTPPVVSDPAPRYMPRIED